MKATGPDSIPAFILKVATDKLAQILARFFQLSLDTGVVTMDWKHARVVPIFTKGQKHLAANYRPVSFTSITRTILEHKVHSCIMIHFDTNNILTDTQHGFKRKRSCGTKLIITIHQIAKSLPTDPKLMPTCWISERPLTKCYTPVSCKDLITTE